MAKKTQARQPADGKTDSTSTRLAQALAHPMRVQILSVANLREVSPSEFGRENNVDVRLASYHFRALRELGALELVGTRPVRGSVEHIYRGTQRAIFSGGDWENLPKSIQDGLAGAAFQDLITVTVQALESGAFSKHKDSHLIWDSLCLDEQGRKAIAKMVLALRSRALKVQDESVARMAKSGEESMNVALALSNFEMATVNRK
jgi:DNA-binding transcriptional ArsR family regulator